jgi:hypothetical protein
MATKLPPEHYLKYWQAAAAAEYGILIQVLPEDQVKLVNALYECRLKLGGYEDLMIFQPQPPGQLFIAKKLAQGILDAEPRE